MSVADDIGCTAAAIDIANRTYLVLNLAADGILIHHADILDIGDVLIFLRQVNGIIQTSLIALDHVDVHRGIAIHDSARAETATEHIADAGAGNHVQFGVAIELLLGDDVALGIVSRRIDSHAVRDAGSGDEVALAIVFVAIYRVGCQVAAKIEIINNQGIATGLFDGHLDGALDGAAGIVAAEDALEVAAGDDQVHPTLHVGIAGTAIDIVHVIDAT